MSDTNDPGLVVSYDISRKKATLLALGLGVLTGVVNTNLDVDFSLRWALLGWLALAFVTVISLHEGIHGLTARMFGHKPIFGLKPPLVFVTFDTKVPRGHFIVIALAPLIVLDIVFAVLYSMDVVNLFADLGFVINTLGAVGDVWIVLKLLPQKRGTLVRDTKTGIEVWRKTPVAAGEASSAQARISHHPPAAAP